MALYNGIKRQDGSRSNTGLHVSGHASPSQYWLIDPKFATQQMSGVFNNGFLFEYQYGGPGMTEVVIAKGRVVGVGDPVMDFIYKKYSNVITLPGLTSQGNTVGMAPYNFTKNWTQQDRFGGNQPSIITQDYVELPYIPGVTASATMDLDGLLAEEQELSIGLRNPWGAVLGSNIKCGDYVKATASGRLQKWDKTTDPWCDVVGQILAMDLNAESIGWFKWVMWDENAKHEDDAFVNKSGTSNLPSDGGYPFDPEFRVGTREMDGYYNQFTTNPTGIPGLHDGSGNYTGYGKNDTEITDMVLGTVPVDAIDTNVITVSTLDAAGGVLPNLQPGVTIKIDGTLVDAANLIIDYKTGKIAITITDEDNQAGKTITGSYKAYFYGTPSSLDFKGVVGSARILLLK